MDVKTLCLGALTSGDMTGYEIKKAFEQAFSHFFAAGFGSIYPALADLTDKGLVTCESVEQDKRPDKKVYSLTETGYRALVDDLAATSPRHKVRSEFLVLMFFAHLLPPARVGEVMDTMVANWRGLIEQIGACETEGDLLPGQRFTIGYAKAVLGAAAAYVEGSKPDLVARLRAERDGDDPDPSWPDSSWQSAAE